MKDKPVETSEQSAEPGSLSNEFLGNAADAGVAERAAASLARMAGQGGEETGADAGNVPSVGGESSKEAVGEVPGDADETTEESESEVDPDSEGAKPAPKRAPDGKFTVDRKAVDKWLLDNPREAAKLFPDTPEQVKGQFVALAKKRQRLESRFREAEQLEQRIQALGAEQQQAIDDAIGKAQPGIDILDAIAKEDFVALDLAFHRAGVRFDDWTKKRLRFGASKVAATAESQRIAELEKKLAEKDKPAAKKGEKAEQPAEPSTYDVATIEAELEDHPVRNVADWAAKVQKLTDDDEDLALEDAADQVLKEAKKALGFQGDEEDENPVRRVRGRRRPQRSREPEADEDDGLGGFAPSDFEARFSALRGKYGL